MAAAPLDILIFDDDPGILEALQLIFDEENYATAAVADEDSLYALLRTSTPKLMLIDLLLSGTTGVDVAKRLKVDARTKAVPMLLMSADPRLRSKAVEAEVEGYIRKPFDLYELLETVRKYL